MNRHFFSFVLLGTALIGQAPCQPDDDADGDGYTEAEGDCDDADASTNPGAEELCDGLDNNCDNVIDLGCPGPNNVIIEDQALSFSGLENGVPFNEFFEDLCVGSTPDMCFVAYDWSLVEYLGGSMYFQGYDEENNMGLVSESLSWVSPSSLYAETSMKISQDWVLSFDLPTEMTFAFRATLAADMEPGQTLVNADLDGPVEAFLVSTAEQGGFDEALTLTPGHYLLHFYVQSYAASQPSDVEVLSADASLVMEPL